MQEDNNRVIFQIQRFHHPVQLSSNIICAFNIQKYRSHNVAT